MATQRPFQFGLSEFTTMPWSFEEDVENYAQLGVDAIEVCEEKLDERRLPEQLALIGQHGLAVGSVQPKTRTLFPSETQAEPKDVGERMALFRRSIERIAGVGSRVPFVTNTGIPPKGNIQHLCDVAAREYRALAEFAQEHDARVALEPLNASIMNVESAIWTLQQGMEIVAALDRPNFGICLDVWNIWQNADIAAQIAACDRIFVAQFSDWRTPRSHADRLVVGQGAIPLPGLIRAIHQSGYRGPYVVEIFSKDVPDSLWEGDLLQVIADSRAGLQAAWQEALGPA